jgi:Uncharacterized enzyme involved in inositol metabolism
MFIRPKFDISGRQIISRVYGKTAFALQNITVQKLKAGETAEILEPEMETAVLLIKGDVEFFFAEKKEAAGRASIFSDPTLLHVPKDVPVAVTAEKDSEILIQSTFNDKEFEPKIYRKGDYRVFVGCEGKWENTAVRDVVTILEYDRAPYSNMVVGEVYARQGRWWSYIPHHHPQPEVYYYKFERPEGFGACFIGEKAYTIKDGAAGLFEAGKTHPQVTAPGYPMYCAWMIRHLEGNPWRDTRTDDERYSWLLK